MPWHNSMRSPLLEPRQVTTWAEASDYLLSYPQTIAGGVVLHLAWSREVDQAFCNVGISPGQLRELHHSDWQHPWPCSRTAAAVSPSRSPAPQSSGPLPARVWMPWFDTPLYFSSSRRRLIELNCLARTEKEPEVLSHSNYFHESPFS